ncbi:MAG: DUF2332 family protein [Polyangiaceae bacterium]|nr:DUF2332 family protein [Polyangiaceae bacterium]
MSDAPPKSSQNAATDDFRFRAGDRIAGRYEVLAPIGRGGMGVVYRVRDHELEDVVALKVLHRDLVRSPEMLTRFRKEVKLARRVTHRNVARTFDIGEHEGERFLTMELIEGEPLSAILHMSGRLEVTRALDIGRQILEGMAAAHDAGIVHRDLKPENISVANDGRVVVMDFGIARANVVDDALKTSGEAWGTPAYMAPEQVEAADVDARADQYAFGALLFEMITGKAAWTGSSAYVIAAARLNSPPPDPLQHRPELSAELAALVIRCMAYDAAERFENARAVLAAIAALPPPEHDAPAAGPPSSKGRQPVASPVARAVSTGSASPAWARTTERFERRVGAEGFRDDIERQLVLMANASPSYRRVLEELDRLLASTAGRELHQRFEKVWQKRSFEGPFERPLLLLSSLRADARAEGKTHPLYESIAAETPDEIAVTREALQAALAQERIGLWIALRSRRVQTNEITRSLAWLWPATLAGAGGRARPLALFDIGTSAGLNLVAEAVDVPWRRSTGEPLTVSRDLDIRCRTGFDPRPLDIKKADDREWLKACIWPEQRQRMVRLEAAIRAFESTLPAPKLILVRASSAVARIQAATNPGELTIAFQTLVRGYIPVEERDAYEQGMRAWVAAGARGERMWSVLELEEIGRPESSCALDVHIATGDGVEVIRLARMSYHPDIVEVALGAEARMLEISSNP